MFLWVSVYVCVVCLFVYFKEVFVCLFGGMELCRYEDEEDLGGLGERKKYGMNIF